jgi:hypothetical protein
MTKRITRAKWWSAWASKDDMPDLPAVDSERARMPMNIGQCKVGRGRAA